MPRPAKKEKHTAAYFAWRLGRRGGVWQADGRSNAVDAGRHSLGTRDRAEALRRLQRLDLTVAVEHGLADPAALRETPAEAVSLEEGRDLYLAHAGRARVAGGARQVSVKRYRAVFDKFLPIARGKGLSRWDQVTRKTLDAYGGHLEREGYAYRTQYLELTTLKQVAKFLIEEERLPASARIVMRLEKPEGTDTYCWRAEEVAAMLEHCRSDPELGWLAAVIHTLALTGLRISELRDLRRSDLDLVKGVIRLTDDSTRKAKTGRTARTTKSGRDRVLQIHGDLTPVLANLPRHADGLTFHGPRGGRLKPDVVRRTLIRDVLGPLADHFPSADGEVGFKDGRLHSFRHFFCSLCANNGVPEQVVMSWLGHADSGMVRHYYHLHDAEARRHMDRLTLAGVGG